MTQQIEWKGSYFDGKSLLPQSVFVSVEPQGLKLSSSHSPSRFWPYSELRQTQGRYAGEEVRLERGEGIGEALMLPNSDILANIHEIGGEKVSHFHHPGTRHKRFYWTVAAGLASLPIIYGVITWGIPWLAGPITSKIPISWEEKLGQFVHREFTTTEAICDHPRLSKAMNSIVENLTQSTENLPYTFTVTIIDKKREGKPIVNAMASPGGYLIVFRGLLQDTESPEELAGVLAHEIQHVLLRHGLHMIVQHVSMAFVIAALTGDVSGMASYSLGAAHTLQTLSYGRQAETQADIQGLQLLQQAKVNPSGMVSFFEKLRKGEPDQSLFRYLSTHPATHERLKQLQSITPSTPSPYKTIPHTENWEEIRNLCEKTQKPSS